MDSFYAGDYVEHIGIPPMAGIVVGVYPQINGLDMVVVKVDKEERIQWDIASNWKKVSGVENVYESDDFDDYTVVDEN